MKYNTLREQTFAGIAEALSYGDLANRGNGAVAAIMGLLDQYSINVPDGTSVEVNGEVNGEPKTYIVTKDDIQALRDANTTKEVRLALQDICADLGDLSINSFAGGLDVTVAAGSYSYTCNVTIDA